MSIERITVVGGGTMGNGIAHVAAQHGKSVRLVDVSPDVLEAALAMIRRNLERQVAKQLIDEGTKEATLARIETTGDLAAAARGVDLVVEAVPEKPELKRPVFEALDHAADPSTVLASNTSSISITEIGAWTSRPDRVIGMHFMNPVPVMALVEVIRGLATSDETTRATLDLATALGKTPVEVNDFPGFVSNRVLMPMINEAVSAYMEGVAEPLAIDTVMKLGMNHPMGPLALADLIGLDTCLNILEVLHRELGDDRYRPSPLLRKYVAAGWLGRKAGRGFYTYDRG
jgi:3-hydroxybutyryl-CoA dehydrogenase